MKPRVAVGRLCAEVGMSWQNLSKARRQRRRAQVDEHVVAELLRAQRRMQPRLKAGRCTTDGRRHCRKRRSGWGRERLFEILKAKGLLVQRLPRVPHTTHSRHSLPVLGNRLKDRVITRPNQAYAADLTYFRTEERHLFFVVGWPTANTLETEGCLAALRRTLAALREGARPLHHSDRGDRTARGTTLKRCRRRGWRSA